MTGKPTVEELGIDVAAQVWHRSGTGDGTIEVAMVSAQDRAGLGTEPAGPGREPAGPGREPAGPGGPWVLMRVAGDPAGRVLVYDRHEWECFLDGVKNGEFDDALLDGALE